MGVRKLLVNIKMEIKIEVDDYEIINSGTLVFEKDQVVNFNFKNTDLDLNFRIKFSEDKSIDHSKFNTNVNKEENYLEIDIINSNLGNNMGNVGLIPLAKISDRQLYLKFMFSNVKNEDVDTLFNYSWYLKKA